MTLLDLKQGEVAVVTGISGGEQLRSRMDGFGLRQGRSIRLVRAAPFRGPLLVEDLASGARMMIGRGMAASVEVRDEERKT